MQRVFIHFACVLALTSVVHAGEWTESSFEQFRAGKFLDAGSNLYVSAHGRMQMINRWDLNGDGHLDIVLPSGHAHTEKEDTYIYLNTGQDIDGKTRIRLAANGSMDGVIRDLNKDGFNDLIVCNGDNGITTYTDLYVYFGAADGFTVARRVTLPAQGSSSIVAGDFDGDGWVDIAVACQWRAGDLVHPTGPNTSFIYWNGPNGFSASERSAFTFDAEGATDKGDKGPAKGAVAITSGKLDGDDRDDLVMMTEKKTLIYNSPGGRFDGTAKHIELPFVSRNAAIGDVNKDGKADLGLCVGNEVLILRGQADGTLMAEPIRLPAKMPQDVVITDLNKDGLDDVAIANYAGADGAMWVNSFVYLSDGKEFAAVKPIEVPSMGARAISAGDLNGDGLPELVISNQHALNENSIPSFVFWNDNGSFRQGNHTELATQGSVGNAIGDVNHDGRPDVVFFNFEGNFRDGASTTRIFWGDGTRDYTPMRATDIATHYITSVAHADLDDDGYVDLILTQSRFISGLKEDIFNSVIIHWGGEGTDRFARTTRLTVDNLAGGVRIADLNRDGWLDMIVGALSTDPKDPKLTGMPIFWGSANGFAQKNRTIIAPAGKYPRVPLIADMNRDGYLDLVSQAKFGSIITWLGSASGFDNNRVSEMNLDREDNLVFVDAADLNKDGWLDLILPCRLLGKDAEVTSFVYYGSADGFAKDRREELPIFGPYEASVADFDKDGWLDVFLASYKGNVRRNWPSSIYFGSDKGLLKRPRVELPTYAASGAETADYDGDGWIDIFITNHRTDGTSDAPGPHNHRAPSQLYWGGPEGFSPKQRWETIGNGPHAMNIRDVGNAYDRGLYEDYTSPAHEIAAGQYPTKLQWKAQSPHGTSVRFQTRYAPTAEALEQSAWQGPKGADSWFSEETDGSTLTSPKEARFMQYRARLISPNGGPTPYLQSVTVTFAE